MVALQKEHTNAAVMAIPRDARGDEHCTVAYLYQGGSVLGTNVERYVQQLARWVLPFISRVTEHDTFGGGSHDQVRVARLDVSPFYTVRHMLERFDKGGFIYKPHITEVNGVLRSVGDLIVFDRIGIWLNDEMTNWRLGSGQPCA